VTCFNNKGKSEYNPGLCWPIWCEEADSLEEQCLDDSENPVTPEDESDEGGGEDKLSNKYFHVEIF